MKSNGPFSQVTFIKFREVSIITYYLTFQHIMSDLENSFLIY